MSAETEFPSDKADKYVVRFPDGMRETLKQAAAKNNRSMNAEIIARLEQSFDNIGDLALLRLLARLELQLAESEMLSSMSDIRSQP